MHRVLTESSSTFLRRRRVGRHFERRPLLDALLAKASPVSASGDAVPRAPAPSAVELRALAAAQGNPAAALALLKSQPDGLDAAEAARRLVRDGPNEIQHEPPLPGWMHL